jgi:hypothetical protein
LAFTFREALLGAPPGEVEEVVADPAVVLSFTLELPAAD